MVTGLYAESTGLEVSVNGNHLEIQAGNIRLIDRLALYCADSNWYALGLFNFKGRKIDFDGNQVFRAEQSTPEGNIVLEIKKSGNDLRFEVAFELKNSSAVRHVVCDLFLNKENFLSSSKPLIGKINRTLEIKSTLGTLVFEPENTDIWRLRSAEAQTWHLPALRTTTILASMQKTPDQPYSSKTVFTLRFQPESGAKRLLRYRGMDAAVDIMSKLRPELAELKVWKKKLAEMERAGIPAETAQKEFIDFVRAKYQPPARYSEGTLVPTPRRQAPGKGTFVFGESVKISATSGTEYAAKILADELKTYRGIDTLIAAGGSDVQIHLSIGAKAEKLAPEGYLLTATPEQIEITGRDEQGVIHGVQTLIQLLERDSGKRLTVPAVEICDWPEMAMRGMMLSPFEHNQSGRYLKQAIRRMVSRYKLNTLLLGEADSGNIEWKSHPEITSPAQMSNKDLRELVDFGKAHLLEVIPLVQSVAHSRNTSKAHPEFSDGGDGSTLCLSHPGVRRMLTEIFDEAIEIYRPKYFHLGADEAHSLGQNPLCKNQSQADLLAEHLNFCADYLKKRGVTPIIWHDMLLEAGKWKGTPANSTPRALTHPALDKLSRDIVIDLWSYSETQGFESIKYFQQRGFRIIGSPWHDAINNYRFTEALVSGKALGVIGTSWVLEQFKNSAMTSIVCAEESWSPGAPNFAAAMAFDYDGHLHHAMLPPQPSEMAGVTTVPLDISTNCNRAIIDRPEARGWTGEGAEADLSLLPSGPVTLDGIRFQLADKCIAVARSISSLPEYSGKIAVNRKAAGLVFLHSSGASQEYRKLGEYVVHYEDGRQELIDIVNFENILSARRPNVPLSFSDRLYAGLLSGSKQVWRGANLGGEEISLQAFEWANPYPETRIKELELRVTGKPGDMVFLLGVSLAEKSSSAGSDIALRDLNFRAGTAAGLQVNFFDALKEPFSLEGFPWRKNDAALFRLPASFTDKEINGNAFSLANHSAGGSIRFRTDSPYLVLQAQLAHSYDMNHMPRSGSAGFDLYANGRFTAGAQPNPGFGTLKCKLPGAVNGKMTDFQLNLPLYGSAAKIEIGLAPGSNLLPPLPHQIAKPILFHGSSIVQGGCVSRPGNAYPSLLCRKLDAPQINLGFSGSGMAEPALAEAIAELELSLLVVDAGHSPQLRQFYEIIRSKQPELPILIISKSYSTDNISLPTYEFAYAKGDRKIRFFDGRKFFDAAEPDSDACTVDGIHPNDLGFYRMYLKLLPVIKELLEL